MKAMTKEERQATAQRELEAFRAKQTMPANYGSKRQNGRAAFYASILDAPICPRCGFAKHQGACE